MRFRSSGEAPGKPKRFGICMARPSRWTAFQRAIIVVVFSFLPLINSTRSLAQDKGTTPDLFDKSLEDLMSIEIDSVYGASKFLQTADDQDFAVVGLPDRNRRAPVAVAADVPVART